MASRDWRNAFFEVCKPKPKLTGSQWADEFRYIAPGTSPEAGPWRTSRVPYMREPMDAATDQTTEHVVIMASSQVSKSETLLNILGYYADQEPSPILMVQPTLGMAMSFSKERIDPTFRWSPGLKNKLEQPKNEGRGNSRKSSDTIFMKSFPGGYLALVGANSPAGLASRPIRVVLCDEIDRFSDTKEGDPLRLSMQRSTNFHNRKIVFTSTPTIKGSSPIEAWYNQSDMRQFFIPCPHCGHEFVWRWDCVKWDKSDEGAALPETARLECPECNKAIRGAGRPDMALIERGKWKATGDVNSPIRGYHLNSLLSPWVTLQSLVEEFVAAMSRKDHRGLMEFINLKLGETWDEHALSEDMSDILYKRREYYPRGDNLPPGVLVLTAGVDVQRDRLECTLYGWGVGKECWGIEHRIILGAPDNELTWRDLDAFLFQQRLLANGALVQIGCVCVDSGDGMYTTDVYRYTRQRERMRVFSIKGRGGVGIPFLNPPTKANAGGATLFSLGVDAGKSLVLGRLKIDEEGPGFVHYPRQEDKGFNEEFFQQLTSEVFEQRLEKGVVKRGWKKLRERNEALDCAVYATAALELINPNFEHLSEFYSGQSRGIAPAAPKKRRPSSRGVTF